LAWSVLTTAAMEAHSILVVDDDRWTRESLGEILDDLGYRVAMAERGVPALELLRERSSDLVLSDVDMPDISGFELLSRMRQERIGAPMVLISARSDASLGRAARQAGAAGMLPKPVQVDSLTTLVSRLLDSGKRHDNLLNS